MAQLIATEEDAEWPRDTPKACNSDRVVKTLIAPPKKYCMNSSEINKSRNSDDYYSKHQEDCRTSSNTHKSSTNYEQSGSPASYKESNGTFTVQDYKPEQLAIACTACRKVQHCRDSLPEQCTISRMSLVPAINGNSSKLMTKSSVLDKPQPSTLNHFESNSHFTSVSSTSTALASKKLATQIIQQDSNETPLPPLPINIHREFQTNCKSRSTGANPQKTKRINPILSVYYRGENLRLQDPGAAWHA